MILYRLGTTVIATALFASASFAQTFVEIEPNSGKSEATFVNGIVNGNTIGGTTTGTDITLGSTLVGTMDYFRVKVGALPLGLYKHRLSLATSGAGGHLPAIRGVDQTGTAGIGGIAGTTDSTVQSASTLTPLLFNQWYGFGKQEELYWRVQGTGTSTAPYVATMSTVPVTPTAITPSFESSMPVTISTVGLTGNDTKLFLYDANFDPFMSSANDDPYPPNGTQCEITRTFAPGTYYLAMSRSSTYWNIPATYDDNWLTTPLMDFPNCLVRAITTSAPAQDYSFTITGSNGTYSQSNPIPANSYYEVTWWQFTVTNGAPPVVTPNDACANALDIGTGGAFTGSFLNATNDGAASCDPGGAASRDVWFKVTNPSAVVRTLNVDTCTSAADTVVALFASCGGAELACNDDCGGVPCLATSSCVSLAMNPGQSVRIRVSDKGIGVGTSFTMHATLTFANDDCNSPLNLAGPGLYAFDTDGATTGSQGQLEAICLYSSQTGIDKDLWYTYTGTTNGNATITTCNLLTSINLDSKISVFAGAGCPITNSIACWDDDAGACGQSGLETTLSWPTTCGQIYTIQLGGYSPLYDITGNFQITEAGASCDTPFTSFCSGDGTDNTCPCGNVGAAGQGCNNAAGTGGAVMTSTGVASISADSLVLHGGSAAPFGPGLYFQGSSTIQGGPVFGVPYGHGIVCMGGAVTRLEIVNPADGSGGSQTAGIIHNEGGLMAGGTRNYQLWYRDGVNVGTCSSAAIAFNFSSAITLVWVP